MDLPINQIICGEALDTFKTLPSNSINCCISSPPYWALRDYGIEGQLGLEPTFEGYIDKLCGIYDEVKRVLRPDGTCFVNLGDTYNNATPGARDTKRWPKQSRNDHTPNERPPATVQTKSLCLIPQRFAIEMVSRGWILRNVLIWHKPNPMPSSAKDRFTVDFEYVYFFVKSKKYWFEQQFEPYLTESNAERPRMGQGQNTQYEQKRGEAKNLVRKKPHSMHESRTEGIDQRQFNPLGRNKRCVWTIPTEPRSEAHFATFPQKLVEPMILSGCPRYICTKCGKAREKIYDRTATNHKTMDYMNTAAGGATAGGTGKNFPEVVLVEKGYTDCGCSAEWRAGICLDMFCGSGTVCRVAAQNQRDYIGIDLNPEYIEKIAKPFVNEVETGVGRKETGQHALFP